jgi:hypothetical protein
MDMNVDDLHLRTLTERDAAVLVEATREESARALWDAGPAGPYSFHDAQSALQAWDAQEGRQGSYRALRGLRLVAAIGLMLETPRSHRRGPGAPATQHQPAAPLVALASRLGQIAVAVRLKGGGCGTGVAALSI